MAGFEATTAYGGGAFGGNYGYMGSGGGALFNGYDYGVMNPASAGIDGSDLRYCDDLSESAAAVNKVVWVFNELRKIVFKNVMNTDDVSKEVHFLVNSGVLREKGRYMLKSPFGFCMNHFRTDEPLEKDKFKFVFRYKIDRTKAAMLTYPDQPAIQSQHEMLDKMVRAGPPLAVGIGLKKELYDQAMKAFNTFLGADLKEPQRGAAGIGANIYDNHNIKLPLYMIMEFMQNIEFEQISCALAMMRGDHVYMLRYMQRRSPSMNALIKYDRFKDSATAAHWAKEQNKYIPQYLFGLNKRMQGLHNELDTIGSYFQWAYHIYRLNTDNFTAQQNLTPYVTGAPFNIPAAVLVITQNIRDHLIKLHSLGVNYNTTMVQHITTLSLHDDDMNPMQTLVPTSGVRLVNHNFKYNPNNKGLVTDTVSTQFNMEWFEISNSPILVVTVNESDFSASQKQNVNMTKITNFDFVLPTGCQLTCSLETANPDINLYPMNTTFPNEQGEEHTLKLSHIMPWFCKHVTPIVTYNRYRDHSLYRSSSSVGHHPDGFPRNETLIGQTFLFYHVEPMIGDTEPDKFSDDEIDSDNDEDGIGRPNKYRKNRPQDKYKTSKVLYRNKYVVQNYYTDMSLVVSNTLNLYNHWGRIPENFKETVMKRYMNPAETRKRKMKMNRKIRKRRSHSSDSSSESSSDEEDADTSDSRKRKRKQKKKSSKKAKTTESGDGDEPERTTDENVDDEVDDDWEPEYITAMDYNDHVTQLIVTNPDAFFKSVAISVLQFNTDKNAYQLDHSNAYSLLLDIAEFVCYIENGDYKQFFIDELGIKFNLMDYVNPGMGVLWIKPEFVESDSMIMSRPAGFGNISGMPQLNKVGDQNNMVDIVSYQTSMLTAKFVQSLTHPAMVIPNAFMIGWVSTSTDVTVDPSDIVNAREALERLKTLRNSQNVVGIRDPDKVDGWWPVICSPRMKTEFFESSNSPTGRFFTHWTQPEEFKLFFDNTGVMDAKKPKVFTQNTVFNNMFLNINTYMLYNNRILDDRDCPLTRYMTFNYVSAHSVAEMIDHQNRLVDVQQKRNLQAHEDKAERENIAMLVNSDDDMAGMNLRDENDITLLIGASIPKLCFTNRQLFKTDFRHAESYQLNKVITRRGDFYITGTDALEKFDRKGISHSTFTI